ncbi:MAG: hypothetical protein HOZ81_03730 [Streptomyces sp.]|nr:hypothetical protein [Streptomyces sp.]NUT25701.1 hypothetical protein [Streptomyces sp.]
MFMRLHTPASLCLAAAALLAAAPPAGAEPLARAEPLVRAAPLVRADPPTELPSCATDGRAFPLTTRLHGGPDSYAAGGGFGTWYLDLTNKTGRTCTGIHPVVVLVDGKRALKPSQPRLEFYGTPAGAPDNAESGADPRDPRRVRFETTDQDELVGAFDGFPGFTVGPRETVSVKVRLAVTSDAVPNDVTANAAVIQRHDGDGDWVGQSNDYRFTIDADPGDRTGTADPSDSAAASAAPHSSASPGADPDSTRDHLTLADELARTGLTSPPAVTLAATTTALLLAGGVLLVARRRR